MDRVGTCHVDSGSGDGVPGVGGQLRQRADDRTGDVQVQGYVTVAPATVPAGEEVVHVPADAWQRLLAGLPVGMLLGAIRNGLCGRAVARPVQTGQR